MNRDFWTCGSFSEINRRESRAKAALRHLDIVFGSALAANRVGRGCDANLDAQTSWQAQYSVDFEVQISFHFRRTL